MLAGYAQGWEAARLKAKLQAPYRLISVGIAWAGAFFRGRGRQRARRVYGVFLVPNRQGGGFCRFSQQRVQGSTHSTLNNKHSTSSFEGKARKY